MNTRRPPPLSAAAPVLAGGFIVLGLPAAALMITVAAEAPAGDRKRRR